MLHLCAFEKNARTAIVPMLATILPPAAAAVLSDVDPTEETEQ